MPQSVFEVHDLRYFEVNGWQEMDVNDAPVIIQRVREQSVWVRPAEQRVYQRNR